VDASHYLQRMVGSQGITCDQITVLWVKSHM
jgi:hypothetical protein